MVRPCPVLFGLARVLHCGVWRCHGKAKESSLLLRYSNEKLSIGQCMAMSYNVKFRNGIARSDDVWSCPVAAMHIRVLRTQKEI